MVQLKGLTPTGMLPRYTLLGGQAGLQDGRVGVCLGVSVGVSACEWVGWSLCVGVYVRAEAHLCVLHVFT